MNSKRIRLLLGSAAAVLCLVAMGGYGAAFMGGKRTDEATLWKSRDGGTTWSRVNVGTKADGAAGNSDVDLAVARDGTLYFATLVFDDKVNEGKQISIGVSKDVGMTWRKEAAPGYREWNPDYFPVPRWVEPLAWDARGVLYSLWTNLKGVWLARSIDQGATWTTWRLAESSEVAYFPYLVSRGPGELAATWFSGWTGTWKAHVARIDVDEGGAPPRVVESRPFKPDSWRQNQTWPEDPPTPDTAGEYLPILFLRKGGLVVVSPIQNKGKNRFGFSLWRIEERRGESQRAK